MARRARAWGGAALAAAALLAGCTAPAESTGATPAATPSASGSQVVAPGTAPSTATAPPPSPEPDGDTEPSPTADPAGSGLPEPTIVSATRSSDGAVEVSGLVPGLVQNGGTCTATVTVGGTEHSASVDALADVSSTTCGTIRVAAPAGSATARLTYHDAGGAGVTSQPVEVDS